MEIPAVPEDLAVEGCTFAPALDLGRWAISCLVAPDGAFHNPRHIHLLDMEIGWLLTNVPYVSKGIPVVGRAEMGSAPPGLFGWNRARWEHQIEQWFGEVEFVITLFAPYVAESDPVQILALLDHELCHCVQKTDSYGNPQFHATTGRPMPAIQGHDVEEFVEVVERWGAGVARGVSAMVAAASRGPIFGEVDLSEVGCGTCKGQVA